MEKKTKKNGKLSIANMVDRAAEIDRMVKELTEELAPLKDALKDYAHANDKETVEGDQFVAAFRDGSKSTVNIAFLRSTVGDDEVVIKKLMTPAIAKIRAFLPSKQFGHVVKTTVYPKEKIYFSKK